MKKDHVSGTRVKDAKEGITPAKNAVKATSKMSDTRVKQKAAMARKGDPKSTPMSRMGLSMGKRVTRS